jgi:hypothetical protein
VDGGQRELDLPPVPSDGSRLDLMLTGIEVSAWQVVHVPRQLADPDREADDLPDGELAAMFARVRAALFAWAEVGEQARRRPSPRRW